MPAAPAHTPPPTALRMHLEVPAGARPSTRRFPVRVVFSNPGDAPARVLDRFEPLPVFFSFTLYRPDETPIALPGGGKIDFAQEHLPCAEVAPGGTLAVSVDLAPLFDPDLALPPGRYRLEASYHNQYGEACFRGRVESPALVLHLSA